MDMLRFDRFTAGRYWVDDYGDPAVEKDFRVLRAYSPYHNIRERRGLSGHAGDHRRYRRPRGAGAQLQICRRACRRRRLGDGPPDPHRDPRRATGRASRPTRSSRKGADVLAFLAHWTGLKPPVD
jgi:prolyl oligopeptidase